MTHKVAINIAKELLKDIDTNTLDAEILMMFVLKVAKIDLYLKTYELSKSEEELFFKLINERKELKPIAYIINEKEFMGLPFYVDENVLIPRPDTEILLYKAIDIVKKYSLNSFLDIGCGSGCITISLAHYTNIKGLGVDIFQNNIDICYKNAKNNNCENVEFILSDVFENVTSKYDLIISNPPYIDIDDISTMGKNVVDYEPCTSLFAKNNGLFFYEEIIKNACSFLNINGFLAFEIGYNQKIDVCNLLENYGYSNIVTYKDYGNNDRVVIGQLAGKEIF